MNKFFTEKENLNEIIENEVTDIVSINKISTGWTNIVFDVKTIGENYIFRFPRNDFFASKIEKDVVANNFLKKHINLKTVDMSLKYNSGRAFSIHKKIEGSTLTERINHLSEEKSLKIAEEIAEFYYTLHNIKLEKLPDICKERLSDFLMDLAKIDDNYYDYSGLLELQQDEENNLVFVHGDLNIGNILLDENDNICAFIDFAFAGLSDIYCDLSRISCRVNYNFLHKILLKYEELSGKNLDRNKIEKRNIMWKYVEEQYIVYMKNNFPEIKL